LAARCLSLVIRLHGGQAWVLARHLFRFGIDNLCAFPELFCAPSATPFDLTKHSVASPVGGSGDPF
jgi:hypothetical protein